MQEYSFNAQRINLLFVVLSTESLLQQPLQHVLPEPLLQLKPLEQNPPERPVERLQHVENEGLLLFLSVESRLGERFQKSWNYLERRFAQKLQLRLLQLEQTPYEVEQTAGQNGARALVLVNQLGERLLHHLPLRGIQNLRVELNNCVELVVQRLRIGLHLREIQHQVHKLLLVEAYEPLQR